MKQAKYHSIKASIPIQKLYDPGRIKAENFFGAQYQ